MGSIAAPPDTDEANHRPTAKAWWKESSVYQIYPASFKDSNGDGIGDIPGIISKLDYVHGLGVDIVWLNPVFESPQIDMGYDISDYYKIHPPYGTVQDVEELISKLHERKMKLVMDLVVNHTSDQHHWFREARSSIDNRYRDWYIWRKPVFSADGKPQPPNNWVSYFGGSAWEYDQASGEYYLHLFAKEQPDLNWENSQVRSAVHQIIRHWLDKGVDGFRMDVINFISKDPLFPDAPITDPDSTWQSGAKYYACGPKLHHYLREIGAILKAYDAFSVGEMPEVSDVQEILNAVGYNRGELNMIFHFELVSLDHGEGGKFTRGRWKMQDLKAIVSKWQTSMHQNNGWNALYLENHDQPRTVSRFASDKLSDRALSAKMLATFLGFQSGTIFIYQGQELGMPNVPLGWTIEEYRDIETLNHWQEYVLFHEKVPPATDGFVRITSTQAKDSALQSASLAEYRMKSRDNGRTPMQWDATVHAGFSIAKPWISVHDDYPLWNAEIQVENNDSVYHYWSNVLRLRKRYPEILVYGSFDLISSDHPDVFAYTRTSETGRALAVINFRASEIEWTVPEEFRESWSSGSTILSNYSRKQRSKLDSMVYLAPFEAFLWLAGVNLW
ncbi:CAZyme family GH13 [Penicillium longicatenatum]|uniref:CAZyme family GH13 n=1 Tax=Penicillium longicatenatum TaxID=1561947 RepID=UPI0025466970|nr:CAZyme family GH13 [Penicillium longicatenatum]KAJ5649621.1 CAZyme family GH13 [Penicillium longicatenatum]